MNNFETVYSVVFEADHVILRVNNGFAAKARGVPFPFETFLEALSAQRGEQASIPDVKPSGAGKQAVNLESHAQVV